MDQGAAVITHGCVLMDHSMLQSVSVSHTSAQTHTQTHRGGTARQSLKR